MAEAPNPSSDLRSPVIYQNADRTVTLLDLPLSISRAQGAPVGTTDRHQLRTSAAPLTPFPSTEPKTDKARARLLERMPTLPHADAHVALIEAGLHDIRERYHGSYCYPRSECLLFPLEPRGRKRKATEPPVGAQVSNVAAHSEDTVGGREHYDGNISRAAEPTMTFERTHKAKAPWRLAVSTATNTASSPSVLAGRLVSNSRRLPSALHLSRPNATCHIPAGASFCLDSITTKSAARFSAAILRQFPCPTATAGPGQFDVVVADPPWHNRSARRAKAYAGAANDRRNAAWKDVAGVLGPHLAPGAVVAVWVTNGSEPRREVEDAFGQWGVTLMEEWVWAKVTVDGDCVGDVRGLWRKPWEVCMVGRKARGDEDYGKETGTEKLVQRVIVAVPDLHSRKPCLRELLEPMVAAGREARGLEIFARYLSRGWCALGDEVLVFSCMTNWREIHIAKENTVGPDSCVERT